MKTPHDPRHLKRIKAMQELFTWEFHKEDLPKGEEALSVIENLPEIDKEIEKAAPTWPIAKINKVDLSILRLAIFELIMDKEIPFRVIVDEAIELAKEFGTESSPSFVNGALGNVIAALGLDKQKGE